MSARAAFPLADWRLAPDQGPDVEEVTYAMQCAECKSEADAGKDVPDVQSEASENVLDGQSWVFRHARRNPGHHVYREIVTRPWRATMAE